MANNDTLPATGAIVEDLDIGSLVKRQVVTISPRDLSTGDSIGALTESAPATDTASAGLNGRLQRLAQRVTALIALLPGTLGQTTKANSLSVTVASNQVLDAKEQRAATGTQTNVGDSITAGAVL